MLTCGETAAFFLRSAERVIPELEGLVGTVVMRASIVARSYIGHPQSDWAPLSNATIEGFRHENGRWIMGKEALGYGGQESPLLRTGQLKQSISFETEGLRGVVGSTDKVALYHEMGTPFARYPMAAPNGAPRPIFSKALTEAVGGVQELAEPIMLSLLIPGR